MNFKYLSEEAEALLHLVISEKKDIFTYTPEDIFDGEKVKEEIREKGLYAQELKEANCCEYTRFISGGFTLQLKPDGNNYFKNKTRYEQQKQNPSINVTASNNSPVNLHTGNGQAIQNVSIYTAEQNNAINEFKDAVSSSSELDNKQKAEIIELLASLEESKAQNKNFIVQTLVTRINEIVTTSSTLHAIWTGVTAFF